MSKRRVIPASATDVFGDERRFMRALGQKVEGYNPEQVKLYLMLMLEELGETLTAAMPGTAPVVIKAHIDDLVRLVELEDMAEPDKVELFDGLLDVIVVTTNAGISAGFPMQRGWDEVLLSNMAKVDPRTGKVTRRADGKVLKPKGWTPPNLQRVLDEAV